MTFYVNIQNENSSKEISYLLKKCILHQNRPWSELVFLCIGSDRATGDCLGPYVGHLLCARKLPGIFVYGTLTNPVHALNLKKTSAYIQSVHPQALIIAVDASLGDKKHLGYVTIANGALYPGAGVQKDLPPVGDIHITGIVNVSGMLEQLTLQTTRLSIVVQLADAISQGILDLLPKESTKEDRDIMPDLLLQESLI